MRPFNKRGLTLRDFYIFNNYSTKIIPKDTLVTNNDVKRNNYLDNSAIIIEARTQSKRFPNKIFKKIGNYKLLHFLLKNYQD